MFWAHRRRGWNALALCSLYAHTPRSRQKQASVKSGSIFLFFIEFVVFVFAISGLVVAVIGSEGASAVALASEWAYVEGRNYIYLVLV